MRICAEPYVTLFYFVNWTAVSAGSKDWHFYLSFAFFRIAAILQGVYKRSLSSQVN
jgi:hypothetical protein